MTITIISLQIIHVQFIDNLYTSLGHHPTLTPPKPGMELLKIITIFWVKPVDKLWISGKNLWISRAKAVDYLGISRGGCG